MSYVHFGSWISYPLFHDDGADTVDHDNGLLVDGSKSQANTLGADLVARNKPHLSGIYESKVHISVTIESRVSPKFAESLLR